MSTGITYKYLLQEVNLSKLRACHATTGWVCSFHPVWYSDFWLTIFFLPPNPGNTKQIASLAVRSGNGLLLKGGKEAKRSNAILHKVHTFVIELHVSISCVILLLIVELLSISGYHFCDTRKSWWETNWSSHVKRGDSWSTQGKYTNGRL